MGEVLDMLQNEDAVWLEDILKRIKEKIYATSKSIGDHMPHLSVGGKYDNWGGDNICWWTNGFWAGLLWLLYRETHNEYYKTIAESIEEKLDNAFELFDALHHDVGFMWSLTAVANYKITGNDRSRRRGLLAASLLAARFNVKGGYIRAWNGDKVGWSIIDSMMNLPILYWASEQTNDKRFENIALLHATKTMNNFVRSDGSCNHIVVFDPDSGEMIDTLGGQGYEQDSSWSRGQAWALYGFMLSYIYTKESKFLNTAKRIAHYFIANIYNDYIPNTDFRSPPEPVKKDSTAGVIAACGLIEIAKATEENERAIYLNAAKGILRAIDEKSSHWGEDEEAMITNGMIAYHSENGQLPIIYGDYFFVEAILKLKGRNELFW